MCRTYYPVGLRTQLKVPLKSVSIQIKVVDFFSSATMEQEYRNEESFSINTEFVFLVRQNISITNLSWEIDGISSEAKIKDCKEANKLFQSAVKRGFLAGILEFENGRFLTMKIGNLNPWSVIKISVQFVEVLAIDETNHLTLELPSEIMNVEGME
ncbi:hypothetical protein TCAL_15029 [Tigriopus californicus]|uniref:VIT domain-containing protein n=1 Tax=Tigriopus californicus TaxID=6832 RepID=A0A553NZL6_TIGCA|nr:hypothetical protein TCAL_15029 [Tigriopus californicus]